MEVDRAENVNKETCDTQVSRYSVSLSWESQPYRVVNFLHPLLFNRSYGADTEFE